jgi:phosphocarrier protein
LDGRLLENLVTIARRFESEVSIESNRRRANAKSLFSLATLLADGDSPVRVAAKGTDADEAVASIEESLVSYFAD